MSACDTGIRSCNSRVQTLHEEKWPAQLIDGKAAIRYLRANAEKLNLDPDRFAVWGNSAGGTVTQLLAVTADEEDMDDLNVGVKASSKIDCAIAWYTISELLFCRAVRNRHL